MTRSTALEAGLGPAATGKPVAAGPLRASWWRGPKLRKNTELTILLAPGLVLFVGFVLVPIVIAAYYSFYSWPGYGPLNNSIGFRNYTFAFQDPAFQHAIEHTLTLTVASLVIQGPLAILLALLLNQNIRGRSIIRVLIFVPFIISEVIVGTGWSLMLQSTGAVNDLLHNIGLGFLSADWLADPNRAIWTLMGILTWKYIGFAVILMLAGLQSIPGELSEAARIDGASYWQVQRHIMVPLLGPTIRIWAFLSILGALQPG